jgi:hypothetical protein
MIPQIIEITTADNGFICSLGFNETAIAMSPNITLKIMKQITKTKIAVCLLLLKYSLMLIFIIKLIGPNALRAAAGRVLDDFIFAFCSHIQ